MTTRRRFDQGALGIVVAAVFFVAGVAAIAGRALQTAARAGDDNLEHIEGA